MKNMKIGKKLILGFGVTIMASVILMALSISALKKVERLSHNMYTGPFVGATEAMNFSRDVYEIEATLYNAMVEQNLDKYEDELESISEDAGKSLELIQKSAGDQSNSLEDINRISDEAGAARTEVMDLMKKNDWDGAREKLIGEYAPIIEECADAAEQLYQQHYQYAENADTQANKTGTQVVWMLLGVFAVLFIVSVLIIRYLIKGITIPIEQLDDAYKKMSQGYVNQSIDYVSEDELGTLSESCRITCKGLHGVVSDLTYLMDEMANGNFNIKSKAENLYVGDFKPILLSIRRMNINLSSTLSKINDAADQVASGAEQVSSGAQGLSQGATEQASSVEELAATINEISDQVRDTADNAKEAKGQVEDAGRELSRSSQSMEEMMQAMEEISSKSSEIGKIIKTIEDIAFQTNILALNAAVEAARAGEAGKGFAVVADEVRNLASKSAEAAKNTTLLIEGSISAVEDGTRIAKQTASAIYATVESAEKAVDTVERISDAAEQQAESVAEVTQGVDQISSVVQTNSATAEESAAASEELSSQSQILKGLVGQFRLREDGQNGVLSYGTAGAEINALPEDSHSVSSAYDNYSKY
ncbi:MAG TPA: methyl-accepting chemotaxis protein [Candidatus Blautia stercoravium]|nr:methyl-accepting chemotaxis protein [Candidatus Blautia stercoravium]